jgi:hypothetical protein
MNGGSATERVFLGDVHRSGLESLGLEYTVRCNPVTRKLSAVHL